MAQFNWSTEASIEVDEKNKRTFFTKLLIVLRLFQLNYSLLACSLY